MWGPELSPRRVDGLWRNTAAGAEPHRWEQRPPSNGPVQEKGLLRQSPLNSGRSAIVVATMNRNHVLMDIKPVARSSVAKALALSLLYTAALLTFFWWLSGPFTQLFLITVAVLLALVFIFELRAFHAKHRSEDGLEMTVYGAFAQGRTSVDTPAEKMPLVVLAVCSDNEQLGLTENDPTGGAISTGVAFSSWGERIRYSVRALSPTECEVTATCRPASPFTLTNWGRSEKHLYRFLNEVRRGLPAREAVSPIPSGLPRPGA